MAAEVEGRCGGDKLAFFNKEPTVETVWNFCTKGSFTSNGRNRLKRPHDHRFCLNSWKEDCNLRPGWALKTRCAGPTKTTVQATVWTYFPLREEGKDRIKVSSIFVKDMTGNLVEHTFSCLTDILFRTSHWTISNSLLNTRLIEAEVNVPKSVKKPKSSIWLTDQIMRGNR